MDADTLINDGFIEEAIDDDDSDNEIITLMERVLRDYWECHFGLDAPALAETLIETLEENGYEIKATLAD
jgi:hypothetical protein